MVAYPIAQHDVVVHDWLDDGVPDRAPSQQRLRQAPREHVPHPPAHVCLSVISTLFSCLGRIRCLTLLVRLRHKAPTHKFTKKIGNKHSTC